MGIWHMKHVYGMMRHPTDTWKHIRDEDQTISQILTGFLLPMAAIAPIAAFVGSVFFGWRIGAGDVVRMTASSGVLLAIAYYFAIIVATFSIAKLIHWMSETYDASQSLSRCLALAAYTITPLFLAGVAQIIPIVWLNYLISLPLLAYTVYVFNQGLPIMMEISGEKSLLFAGSVLLVGLIALVGMLVATAFLWGHGFMPQFTN
jgi:hypothetical protein